MSDNQTTLIPEKVKTEQMTKEDRLYAIVHLREKLSSGVVPLVVP